MTEIIVALDKMIIDSALELAKKLSGMGLFFKVNDLLDDIGPEIITKLNQFGKVMDDPKFHDIPNTVGNRAKKHSRFAPYFITVHAAGGIPMMRSAVAERRSSRILAITVLTSLNEEQCNINLGGPVKAKVLQYARYAVLAGVQGIVCSPKELEFLSKFPELQKLIKVTPGVRPLWHLGKNDDQSRVTTPAKAVELGSDYLVIGRPLTEADDPVRAVKKTQKEIADAKTETKE